jgi:hypothetical protein
MSNSGVTWEYRAELIYTTGGWGCQRFGGRLSLIQIHDNTEQSSANIAVTASDCS